jgi:protein-disulfide isomerase
LIDERILALEAAARKSTPAALIDAANAPRTMDRQVLDFYEANKNQLNQPFGAVSSQIRDYLDRQANENAHRHYINSLRVKYQAVALLEPYRDQVAPTGPLRGSGNAPVTIIEFSDFQCPFCGRFAPVVQDALKKYPSQVRLIYRHFPLTELHPNAQKSAEAAVCARNQGKFWEMHDLLFAEQAYLSIDALKEKAKRLGLDSAIFNECLDSGNSADAVRLDAAAGQKLGITGTPATFVNGRLIRGTATLDELSAVIDDELRRAVLTARR